MFEKAIKCILGCLAFLIATSFTEIKQSDDLNYKVHALFIYHFTKYINWPESVNKPTFLIGILGKTPLEQELKQIVKDKKINGKQAEVKTINSTNDDLNSFDIVFVAERESNNLKGVIQQVQKNPVLIVTEKQGMIQKGADINFLVLDEKLRFELSKSSLTEKKLRVSNELIKLATSVQ